jgi:uncharacterized protein (PEP-CTERM system associated)
MVGIMGVAGLSCACAQDVATRRGLSLVPELGIRQTLTDNVSVAGSDRRAELITEVGPRLRLISNAGLVRGSLDYSLTGIVYARSSSSNNVQQSLRAEGTVEAIEKRAFIDVSASISQQNISALGTQASDSVLLSGNRTEVAAVRVAPYVRGRIGSFAEYEARLALEATNSSNSNADSRSADASLHIGSDPASFARLGWAADYSHQAVDFNATGSSVVDRLTGTLTFAATNELRLSARGGRENNDLLTSNTQQYNTWGWGATWAPSERTRVNLAQDHRFFGKSHNVRLEHRMPRSVWTFSDSRDLSTNSSRGGASGQPTVFDLLFAQFASIAPDPVQRAALVDAYLQNNGLTRASLANGGVLTSGPSIQRNQIVSVALLGARTTFLVSTFRNDAQSLDSAAVVTGNLANGDSLRQTGQSVNVSHRLTPVSALSVDLTRTKTSGGAGNQSTDLRSLTATWSSRLGERVDGSLSARRTSFDSSTNPYRESAVIANLRLRF